MTKKKNKTKPKYTHAICQVSVCPIRKKADDASEIISQMLFGELCVQITKKNKSWVKIECEWDAYVGWVDPKQLHFISEEEYDKLKTDRAYALELTQSISVSDMAFPVLMGSSLPKYDGMSSKIDGRKFVYNGQAIIPDQVKLSRDLVVKVAMKYLHAPYLWGGRSPFGVDCSGFTQMVYKLFDIRLPRDAYQQAEHGELIDFVELAQPGDLAFFENKEGRIHHVGIVLENKEIIHSSGFVRIDRLDHFGIYHHGKRSYTHKLRFVRRLLPAES